MIEDMLQIALYPCFPPFQASNHPNDFVLLFRDKIVHSKKVYLNKRRPFTASLYPLPITIEAPQAIHEPLIKQIPKAPIDIVSSNLNSKDSPLKIDILCSQIENCLCHYTNYSVQDANEAIESLKTLYAGFNDKLFQIESFTRIISYGICKLPIDKRAEIWKIVDAVSKDIKGREFLASKQLIRSLESLIIPLIQGDGDVIAKEALHMISALYCYPALRTILIQSGAMTAFIEVIYSNDIEGYMALRKQFEGNISMEGLAMLKEQERQIIKNKGASTSPYRIHSMSKKIEVKKESPDKKHDTFPALNLNAERHNAILAEIGRVISMQELIKMVHK